MTARNAAKQALVRNLRPVPIHFQHLRRTYPRARATPGASFLINHHPARLAIHAVNDSHNESFLTNIKNH